MGTISALTTVSAGLSAQPRAPRHGHLELGAAGEV